MLVTRMSGSTAAMRMSLFLLRQDAKLTQLNVQRLRLQNLRSAAPVIASRGPVISITTHGSRLHTVYLTLESIAAGQVLPSRVILWLDDVAALNNRPPSLMRLESRGLEICLTKNYGPHTKYYPYLLSADTFADPLVIADDDVLYSRWWLAGLSDAIASNPDVVNCHRAHVVKLSHGTVQPYATWGRCESTEPSFSHFATATSGCIYPTRLLSKFRLAGSEFLQLCPGADDIWLHLNALRAGFMTRQVRPWPADFPCVPGTQDDGLSRINVGSGRNDEQIRRTYTTDDIARLMPSQDEEAAYSASAPAH